MWCSRLGVAVALGKVSLQEQFPDFSLASGFGSDFSFLIMQNHKTSLFFLLKAFKKEVGGGTTQAQPQ